MKSHSVLLVASGLVLGLAGCSDPAGAATAEVQEPVVIEQGPAFTDPGTTPPPKDESSTGAAISSVAEGLDGMTAEDFPVVDVTPEAPDGEIPVPWSDLSMEGLPVEDILDRLIFPDEYEEGEFEFPERISGLEGKEVAVVGYMIPLDWEGDNLTSFMLVRDFAGCCFGGQAQPDEWIEVIMDGDAAPYIPWVPVTVTGTFHIEAIEDELSGIATGCFRMEGNSVGEEV